MITSQWQGKKVAFLGDSITDKVHVGTEKNYWQYLEEKLGITPLVYGINGNRWIHTKPQAEKLFAEHGTDVDAIFIFMGTNDYMGAIMPGEWFSFKMEETNHGGNTVQRLHRYLNFDEETFCGRINSAMAYLKEKFPNQQIVLMTPIHRAFATFSPTNVQPEESFANAIGLYVESYVEKIRQAADIWSCPLIDLYRTSGLYPLTESHGAFFANPETDRLHPGTAGHARIAQTMLYQMLTLPATFRDIQ